MDQPTTKITQAQLPGSAIIAQLDTLRDAHRLGIHVWEEQSAFTYPEHTAELLEKWHTDAQVPTLSLSLLPAKADRITMEPYHCPPYGLGNAGYLVDMRSEQEHPPKVVAAHTQGMNSGMNVYQKTLKNTEWSRHGLDDLARDFAELKDTEIDTMEFNEVLAHIGPSHVKAIVVPVNGEPKQLIPHYEDMMQLQGAIAGLMHAHQGEPIPPVVLYHVTQPNAGTFSYVGQAASELRAVVERTLGTIYASPLDVRWLESHPHQYQALSESLQQLGVDMQTYRTQDMPAPLR